MIMSMPLKQKIDSLVIVGVAAAFQWFFMFTKHNPGLRPVIPFGEDPYDALGSFATIVNIPLCLLFLWRAFRPYKGRTPSLVQIQYLRRTQAAVPLSILVTLTADAIAMMRHSGMWIGTASQNKLLISFASMTVVSGVALWLVRTPAARTAARQRQDAMVLSGIVAALFIFILAFYPEHLIDRFPTHLVTVLIGDFLLFVPVSVLLRTFMPDPEASGGSLSNVRYAPMLVWTGATLAALLIGAWLFVAEVTEGGSPMPPLRLRLLVASVYVGLTVAGMLIAVAFLRRPLGLLPGNPVSLNR